MMREKIPFIKMDTPTSRFFFNSAADLNTMEEKEKKGCKTAYNESSHAETSYLEKILKEQNAGAILLEIRNTFAERTIYEQEETLVQLIGALQKNILPEEASEDLWEITVLGLRCGSEGTNTSPDIGRQPFYVHRVRYVENAALNLMQILLTKKYVPSSQSQQEALRIVILIYNRNIEGVRALADGSTVQACQKIMYFL
jgi:hypothetical protein